MTYKGTGTYQVHRSLLPLVNGGAALHLINEVVATIEPSETGFVYGDCASVGYLSPEGEPEINGYCSFRETGEDGFVLKTQSDLEGGKAKVIGGSGKWAGATGDLVMKRKHIGKDGGTYEYTMTITTP